MFTGIENHPRRISSMRTRPNKKDERERRKLKQRESAKSGSQKHGQMGERWAEAKKEELRIDMRQDAEKMSCLAPSNGQERNETRQKKTQGDALKMG